MFKIEIETGNAAFEYDEAAEISRILRNIADRLDAGYTDGPVRDHNGNVVGTYAISDHDGFAMADDES